MFGFSRIALRARQWRAERKRIALQDMIFGLPIELQKDIGWPAPESRSSQGKPQSDFLARPIL